MRTLSMKTKQGIHKFWNDEEGIGTLEIVLIIAVVVIIFLVFKEFIVETVRKFVGKAETEITKTLSDDEFIVK